jgi:hypothetical protein
MPTLPLFGNQIHFFIWTDNLPVHIKKWMWFPKSDKGGINWEQFFIFFFVERGVGKRLTQDQ